MKTNEDKQEIEINTHAAAAGAADVARVVASGFCCDNYSHYHKRDSKTMACSRSNKSRSTMLSDADEEKN